ncbi:MAG: glycosyl transferase family 2, partial [Chitinophagaceae bacterium]
MRFAMPKYPRMQGKQVFQTANAGRWQRVKWGSRFLLFLFALCLAAFTIALGLAGNQINAPHLRSFAYKPLRDTQSFVYKNSELARRYYGFRKFIDAKDSLEKKVTHKTLSAFRDIRSNTSAMAVRAAFFVDWDPQSFYSLERNINKLNLVIPEWLFFDAQTDTITTAIDKQALQVMRKSGVNIMPMLTNNVHEVFRGDIIHRIITSPAKKERLIGQLIRLLKTNQFAGVNIDFEDLQESTDENLVVFQKELYERLHAENLLVSQDVIPFNEDYNYDALAKYNDYLFVMAYDEFSESTKAGPVAEQKWIEAAIDEATKKLPANKIILGLAAYGYDWPKNSQATSLTYQQAVSIAKESEGKIEFDNGTYNLHCRYGDDNGVAHDVYFTDAATLFNSMRFAQESELGGTAIWRLGSEDSRVWEFYQLNMSKEGLQHFNFQSLFSIRSTDDADYNGQGEVLDVVSTPTEGLIRTEIDSTDLLISEENYERLPSQFIVNAYGWNGTDTVRNRKKIVLTFDDGPSEDWTPRILDILSEKHVPATFFVVGKNVEENIPLLKRIYREGHEIGNHTFLHPNIA